MSWDNYGATCPYCGHKNLASDSDGIMYDESLCEYDCESCSKVFNISVSVIWSWMSWTEDDKDG